MKYTYYCYKCGRELKESEIVWLELNAETGEFMPAGSEALPEDISQGCFPFGKSCGAIKKPMYIEEGMY